MRFWNLFRRAPEAAGQGASTGADISGGTVVYSLDDPRVIEILRDGFLSAAGFTVNPETAARIPSRTLALADQGCRGPTGLASRSCHGSQSG